MYYYTLPDEFVRTQMAVGALVLFGVLRVICAAVGAQHSWRMSTVTRCFIGAAVLFCLPQLIDVIIVVAHVAPGVHRVAGQGDRLRAGTVLRTDRESQTGLRVTIGVCCNSSINAIAEKPGTLCDSTAAATNTATISNASIRMTPVNVCASTVDAVRCNRGMTDHRFIAPSNNAVAISTAFTTSAWPHPLVSSAWTDPPSPRHAL